MGQKEREHDFRTPEGRYYLARRNMRSDYFLAIQVSYPNKEDEVRARKHRWAPGGSIMIHGLPNAPKYPASYYASNDWTDGCIALSNSDMVEAVDAHARQHSDRYLSRRSKAARGNHDPIV